MPLLLRRSAPSPSIDQLAFAVPAAPLSASTASSTGSSSSKDKDGNLRGSTGSEAAHFAQLQRCSTHARMSMARRRSAASMNDTELLCMSETCELEECNDPHHMRPLQLSESFEEEEEQRDPSFRASSKKGTSQDDQQDDEDTATSEWGYGSDAGRASSVPSCACSCRDDDMCAASSTVTIEDKQLAVVDMELRDLRKTFANKLYARLSNMSKSFGRKRGGSTPQLTAS
ncbi:hypothetical protein Gpo141_00001545 [Globisporangium polare]